MGEKRKIAWDKPFPFDYQERYYVQLEENSDKFCNITDFVIQAMEVTRANAKSTKTLLEKWLSPIIWKHPIDDRSGKISFRKDWHIFRSAHFPTKDHGPTKDRGFDDSKAMMESQIKSYLTKNNQANNTKIQTI